MGIYQWSTTAGDNDDAATGIDWTEGQEPSTVNDSARAMMAHVAELLLDISCSNTTGGTSSALTLTTDTTLPALADGVILGFTAGSAADPSATLNVDALGAKTILRPDGTTLIAGDVVSGGRYLVVYTTSGSGSWLVLNPTVNTFPQISGTITTTQITSSAVTAAKIGTGAVTLAKQANLDQYRVIGRVSSSAGVPEALTPNNLLDVIDQATDTFAALYTGAARSTTAQDTTSGHLGNGLLVVNGTNTGGIAIFNQSATGTSAETVAVIARNEANVGSISADTTATTYNTSSDPAKKENVADLLAADAIAAVKAYRPRAFDWIATGEADRGFLSTEFATVSPKYVSGAPGSQTMQAANSKTVAEMIRTLQDLLDRVEALENA